MPRQSFSISPTLPMHAATTICFAVLREMHVPGRLIDIIFALYHSQQTDKCYSGVVVETIDLFFSMRQGCPLSGTMFALALGTFVRWYLCRTRFHHTRRFLYADDLRCLPRIAVTPRTFATSSMLFPASLLLLSDPRPATSGQISARSPPTL